MNQLESLWNFVLDGSLKATVLIACVLLLRPLLRRRVPAQCLHLLWLLVGLRLLLPVAPSSSTSVFNFLHAESMRPQSETSGWMVRTELVTAPVWTQAAAGSASEAASRARTRFNLAAWLPALWFAGVLGQILLLTCSGWRWRRTLADATPVADPQLLSLARQCAETLGLRRRFDLLETDALVGPAVIGLWRPRLLLPKGLRARLTEEQMRFVLLHECAHLRRLDLAAMWLLTAARIVHWFNPFVWLAARLARTDAELACDETVLQRSTDDDARGAYGQTLLSLARLVAWRQPPLPAAGILESRRALRARLVSISRFAGRTPGRTVFAGLVLFGVGLVFAADEKPAPAASEPVTPNSGKAERAELVDSAEVASLPGDETGRTMQIEIESKFIETTDTAILRLKSRGRGIDLLRAALRGGVEDYILTSEEAAEFLRAIESGRGIDLLSAPRVTTKSGQRAVIEIIREFRYPTEWERDKKKLWVPKAFETRNCGVTLEVEPQLDSSGGIVLRLVPQVVEVLGFRDFESGEPFPVRFANHRGLAPRTPLSFPTTSPRMGKRGLRPVFSTRKYETTVTLQPDETIVLAALPETEDVQPFKSPAAARRLIATISARLFDSPPAQPAKPVIAPDGNTLALELVPQAVEFEGFINYGSPIQTTSTNLLGQTVVNVITPKVINPPAFSSGEAAAAAVPAAKVPAGIVRAGDQPGFVRSPYAPEAGVIDARGFPPGTEIKCPYTQKILRVP